MKYLLSFCILLLSPTIVMARKPDDPVDRIMPTVIMTLIVGGIAWLISVVKKRNSSTTKKEHTAEEHRSTQTDNPPQKTTANKIDGVGWKLGIAGAVLGGLYGFISTNDLGQGIIYAIGGFSLLGAPFFVFADSDSMFEKILAILFFGGVLIAIIYSVIKK
ncbi:membrane hypothetical protein [uncultured Desulfobacterium sp.]|uniref:Uncharacterized protein n=1 Tax=uncultured Desulfobacterium sp. TaxID=201089 RepID=A0A445MTV2_9BACT|nr:membrane hypothetical protein [uncultured Desulfobacterium sp.]